MEHIPGVVKAPCSLDSRLHPSSLQAPSISSATYVKESPILGGRNSQKSLRFETTQSGQESGRSGSRQHRYQDSNNIVKHRRLFKDSVH